MLKPLPTSTATFRKIIEGGFLYIDKTQYIYQLASAKTGAYFLSRPRRFGKSILISTLEELFRGNRELFRGLWIDNSDYQWAAYPVIHIDFSLYRIQSAAQLEQRIPRYLEQVAQQYQLALAPEAYDLMFAELILQLSAKFGGQEVVLLIDEYDKPLIENLENATEVREIRNVLKGFYGIVKSLESHIRLTFITGISKFSKVSIFSELNHLSDLTLDNRFANLLGITKTELLHYFQDYLPAFATQEKLTVAELLEKIRHWYDGFRFTEAGEALYNPFSIMNLFEKSSFHNYWFESGTPTFLIKLLHQQNYAIEELSHLSIGELAFSTYDSENLSVIPLLFQTGYLTIKSSDNTTRRYELDFPNYEVENAFLVYLLDAFSNTQQGLSEAYLWRLVDALKSHDIDQFFTILKLFFANIDYALYLENEKYYQTIFYMIFKLIGLNITAEVQTNRGRIDAVVEVMDCIYIFEFKIDQDAAVALQQVQERQYYPKYQLRGKAILCIGANFNTKTRRVDDWQSAPIQPV